MAFDENLADRISTALAHKKGVEEKKMLGGQGFLLHGNMCVGVWKNSMSVRLGPDEGEVAGDAKYYRGIYVYTIHLSISPMTMSMLPTIAGMSAIRQPRHRSLVTLRFEKLEERARTRRGTWAFCGLPTT